MGKLANSIFKKARKAPFDISLTVGGSVVRIMHILMIGEVK